MTGFFCELQLFQMSHPEMTDVYVIIRPQTLRAVINTKDSYTSLLLPLYETDHIDLLDSRDKSDMELMFGKTFVSGIGAAINAGSALARKFYLNMMYKQNEMGVEISDCFSELSIRKIKEMKEFCESKKIKMHFISAPLMLETEAYDFSEGDAAAERYQLEDVWKQLEASVVYYPEECFRDGYHLSEEFLEDNRKKVIASMIRNTEGLDDLKGLHWE